MIGIDTNVLVRYLAQDDPVQSALATQFASDCCSFTVTFGQEASQLAEFELL